MSMESVLTWFVSNIAWSILLYICSRIYNRIKSLNTKLSFTFIGIFFLILLFSISILFSRFFIQYDPEFAQNKYVYFIIIVPLFNAILCTCTFQDFIEKKIRRLFIKILYFYIEKRRESISYKEASSLVEGVFTPIIISSSISWSIFLLICLLLVIVALWRWASALIG